MMKEGTCKLCGITAQLIGKSHIIPNFMYKGIMDETNTMILTSLSDLNGAEVKQTGFFDKNILCLDCDNRLLGGFESYMSHIINGTYTKTPALFNRQIDSDGLKSVHITNMNYKDFRLGFLSILWRAHISNNKFFKDVAIGDSAQEIKELILAEDVGSEEDFKIAAIGIQKQDGQMLRMVVKPFVQTSPEVGMVGIFIIHGIIYFLDLKPSSGSSYFGTHFLQSSGEMRIPILSGVLAYDLLTAFNFPAAGLLLGLVTRRTFKDEIYALCLTFLKIQHHHKLNELKDQIIAKIKEAPFSADNKVTVDVIIKKECKALSRYIDGIKSRRFHNFSDSIIQPALTNLLNTIELSDLPQE